MRGPRPLRVGTRGSALARAQTEQVLQRLRALDPELSLEIVIIRTSGDRGQREVRGAFVKELQHALLKGEIDLAVHSLKDLPTDPVSGLRLAAVLEREDPREALIARNGWTWATLPSGARVGTGSPRRTAQLRALRPDLVYLPLVGNVDTRLRRLEEGHYEAIVLAVAGLIRLGWGEKIAEIFPLEQVLPAPGQGAIAVEVRADDASTLALVGRLNHLPTWWAVIAERAFLRALGGGCRVPIAAYAEVHGERLTLEGRVMALDGMRGVRGQIEGPAEAAEALGEALAERIKAADGSMLLEAGE
ncbi:hydroxymethylbilane synthase [Thermoflexus sp.]|uniref:hydroxymethylbilane synthase n=1 Tax=Thermoflexus sp. TaxID=1969742 RepID=UPI0035E40FB4